MQARGGWWWGHRLGTPRKSAPPRGPRGNQSYREGGRSAEAWPGAPTDAVDETPHRPWKQAHSPSGDRGAREPDSGRAWTGTIIWGFKISTVAVLKALEKKVDEQAGISAEGWKPRKKRKPARKQPCPRPAGATAPSPGQEKRAESRKAAHAALHTVPLPGTAVYGCPEGAVGATGGRRRGPCCPVPEEPEGRCGADPAPSRPHTPRTQPTPYRRQTANHF